MFSKGAYILERTVRETVLTLDEMVSSMASSLKTWLDNEYVSQRQ
jgi:hypothetical protein